MNPVRATQLLREMQALAQQAGGAAPTAKSGAQQADFGAVLGKALEDANQLQVSASQKADAFVRGDNISLTDVVVASQKARISFEAVKEVRNKLLDAYREISNMSV